MNLKQQLIAIKESGKEVKVYCASYEAPIVGLIDSVQQDFLTIKRKVPITHAGKKVMYGCEYSIIPFRSLRHIYIEPEVAK